MEAKKPTPKPLDQLVLDTIQENNPETVERLLTLVKTQSPAPDSEILDSILRLQSDGQVSLTKLPPPPMEKLTAYLHSPHAYWYWTTIVLSIATALIVLLIPDNLYPIIYIRYILGTIYVLWLPGYTFIRALFPKTRSISTSNKDMDAIERLALSLGLSLALVPLTGFLLNYTPWGIRTTPVTLSLLTFSLVCASLALLREYQAQTPRRQQENPHL